MHNRPEAKLFRENFREIRGIMASEGQMTDRVPPRNIEAEMSSLGCMLLSRESLDLAAEKLGADSFYEPSHRTIFEAILDLYERGQIVDLVTVADKLESVGKLDAVGGAVYLTKLADAVPTLSPASQLSGV
jgi:replicative DNA helicase